MAFAHTHHFDLMRCIVPEDVDADEIFGPWVGHEGHECYLPRENTIPSQYCTTLAYAWAVGGNSVFLPDDIGLPFVENGKSEYFMFSVHYNNPEVLSGLVVDPIVDIFSTPEIR